MNKMGFNVLRHAQDNTRIKNGLGVFLAQKGIDIHQVEQNPKHYEDLIMEYSRQCINKELFEESKQHMTDEFNRLCEFHRRHEEELVQKFFSMTNESFIEGSKKYNNQMN